MKWIIIILLIIIMCVILMCINISNNVMCVIIM